MTGPTLITPEPYYVCNGCKHRKVIGPKKHWEYDHNIVCSRRGMSNKLIMCSHLPSSVTVVTPAWCPLLPTAVDGGKNGRR